MPPNPIELYSFKRAAEDIRELARRLGTSRVILGGHDWVSLSFLRFRYYIYAMHGIIHIIVIIGRSHHLPRRPLVPQLSNASLCNLYTLSCTLEASDRIGNDSEDKTPQFRLPDPAREWGG